MSPELGYSAQVIGTALRSPGPHSLLHVVQTPIEVSLD